VRMTPWWSWTQAMAKSTRFVRHAASWLDRQLPPLVIAAGISAGSGHWVAGLSLSTIAGLDGALGSAARRLVATRPRCRAGVRGGEPSRCQAATDTRWTFDD